MNFDELNFGDSAPVGSTDFDYSMPDAYESYGYKGFSIPSKDYFLVNLAQLRKWRRWLV